MTTMSPTTCQHPGTLCLAPFEACFAQTVARWVSDPEQLRLLAPSSTFPLSPARVCRWVKPGGYAYLLVKVETADGKCLAPPAGANPLGYGELNPMRSDPAHLWIGHVLIDPRRRGCGYGLRLTSLLVEEAFLRRGAGRISLVVFPENVAAIRCYDKTGFSFIREERHRFGDRGPRHRLLRFELLRGAYFAKRERNPDYPSDLVAK